MAALLGWAIAGEGSRTMDFLNQDDRWLVRPGPSVDSLCTLESTLVCLFLLPSRRDDLGRKGSTASAKYSCRIASDDVGRLLGSHIRH